ncbi:MAG: cytochrome c, partial [Gammaproteobacteria bacterium]
LPAPNTGSGGLGGGVGGGAPAPNPPLNQVPTPPPAAAPDPAALLATGRAFFDQMCAVCHGSNGEGGVVDPTPLGPGLCTVAGSGSCQDVATLKTYIGTAMPSTAAPCPADCAEATAALIMNFNARALTASVNAGPAFDTHCSSCHSRDGTGVAAWLTPDTCNTVDCSDIYALSNFIVDHSQNLALMANDSTCKDDNCCDANCALETALFISTENISTENPVDTED